MDSPLGAQEVAPGPTPSMTRPQLTIPTRIFLAFAGVLLAFGIVAGASLAQHQRTAETLRLLDEAYVPLTLAIAEAQSAEAILQNMGEYVLDDGQGRRTRQWVNAQQQVIPPRVANAGRQIRRALGLDPAPEDRVALGRVLGFLEEVRRGYDRSRTLYDALFGALDSDDRERARALQGELIAQQGQVARQLQRARNEVRTRIEAVSRSAAEQERRSVEELAWLALLALAAGLAVAWRSQRLLAPLPLLQERVVAVARGDLGTRLEARSDDELGRLGREFERMVDAIAARDESVRDLERIQAQILARLRSAVVAVDARGIVRAANDAALGVLGIGPDAVGQPFAHTGLPARLEGLDEAVARVSSGDDAANLERARLRPHPDAVPGARELRLDVQVTPFGPPQDAADRAVLIIADDVTDALETEARLIQSERLAAMGKMAAHVTHEVRNPLSSIGLNVEVLAEELAGAGSDVQAPLRAIQREIDRLTTITEEYLRLARVPAPRLEPEDVGVLLVEIGRFVERELSAASCTLTVRCESGLPPVALDESQFRQALLNLIRNAREAMPEGGPVALVARSLDGGVEVRVEDRGRGIPESTRARLFELFYSSKERGTGLGLSLTQQIVVAHRGRIRCEDAEGGGTAFTVWLPAFAGPSGRSGERPVPGDTRDP